MVVLGLVLILAGIAPVRGFGPVVYVDDDAPAGGNGMSWATAFKHLQDILVPLRARSSDSPIEIRVAQGVYRPDRSSDQPEGSGDRDISFDVTWGGHVAGGYAGIGAADPNLRDIAAYPTILSGDLAGNDADVRDWTKLQEEPTREDNSRHVVFIPGRASLDGVTITGGHTSASDGNDVSSILAAGMGGGVTIMGANVAIRNCTFHANFAADQGGGLYADERADMVLVGCTFERNVAGPGPTSEQGRGGAAMLNGSKAVLTNCVLKENRATCGGGVCCFDSQSVELVNCLLVGNAAVRSGAAFYGQDGSAKLQNCTAAGNLAAEGCFLSDNSPRPGRGKLPPAIRVDSCILADGGNEITNGYATLAIQYTDAAGGKSAVSDPKRTMVWGAGNIDADPCFADAGHWGANDTPEDPNDDLFVPGDYHLKSRAGRWDPANGTWVQDAVTSPCIDAGNPAVPFDREPQPNSIKVNVGVYGGTHEASKSDTKWLLMTTQGPLPAEGLGVILPHEHIFTDLRGPTVAGYGQANASDVLGVMKPWLAAARSKGVGALIECTSIGVGRNVAIVDQTARESGLPVVAPTGVYGRDNFAPPQHRDMSEDDLTALFVSEIREGIEGTGIKAGFIKIATGSVTMTPLEEKFLRAAGRAASETGAAIASHTPVSSNASKQSAILQTIDPAIRLIWVHAQSENNRDVQRQLAGRGVFIEFDSLGSNPGQDPTLIAAVKDLLAAGYGDRILLSHDAGYYQPGSPNGGTQRSYTYLLDTFIPKLRDAGVDDGTIRMIAETNPIRAFGFKTGE
jgi:phosphotriesterase-related protein